MNLWTNYLVPKSLSEALDALASAPPPVVPIAGGTDLLLDFAQGRRSPPKTLVDLNSVSEMTALELRAGKLFIGAAVPLSSITRNPLVRRHAPALLEACELIGGPQVRNVATLGGNVAHALPAADGTIALLALDATAEIAGPAGNSLRPIGELFVGPGMSALKSGQELIVGFHIPTAQPGEGSSFRRIMRPQGVALPIVNLAVWLECQDETVAAARVAVGPGGPKPWRANAAEQLLAGSRRSGEAVDAALNALLAEVGFRSSRRRATAEYRRHLVKGLFAETVGAAWHSSIPRGD
jgi:CO/xanthine dehydrogenase FAD-binding subunit